MLLDPWHEMHVASLFSGHNNSLGQEYLMNGAGNVAPAFGAAIHSGTTNFVTASTNSSPHAPTLVGSSNGLQIDLIWASSVAKAPWGFMRAIIDAAEYYTTLFSNHEVLKIDVGYGEIAHSSMASNALGESESYGYLTNYSTITAALTQDGFSFSATNEPTTSQFFVTSADAKTLGLASPTSRSRRVYRLQHFKRHRLFLAYGRQRQWIE